MTPTEVQNRANTHYNEIFEKMEKIQDICTNLVTDRNINWGHVGSLSHINETMNNILEGFE